jgi:hypothetical protein
MQKTVITSDISNTQLSTGNIHIFKDFWYNTDFDCSHLSIDTSKEELEKVFGMNITRESTKMWYCTLCNSDLLERAQQQNPMYKNGISGFIDQLDDQVLTIELYDEDGGYEINLCETCWKRHFEKYIRSDEEDSEE